jgi:potassium-transporting ATPase KdpC subunit
MPALRALILFTLITGFGYPFFILGIGKVLFPYQSSGSLIRNHEQVRGSELIGQFFDQPQYFWPRPSATATKPYNAELSSGSNMGPLHPDLKKPVSGIPRDLWTASGSGLDPHISPEAARYQMARVSQARKLSTAQVSALIDRFVEGRQLGILGEERVNVLLLNQALDGK